jgi:histidinol-phosphate/aromatic aminotransferase/cobyric acid decarboxylase-like protein
MHRGCLESWRAWVGAAGVSLGDAFPHEYPTAGANEAIHALLALHAARGGRRVHVFAGEYEGYGHIATALGLEVSVHPREAGRYESSIAASAKAGDVFWISQPSGIDGNVWNGFDRFRDWLPGGAPGVALYVDLTYVGAVTVEPAIDLRGDSIAAVVWSLSKPFGVYYHRIGGLVSRTEIPTLRGHHWFKNLFSVKLGERLMTSFTARELPLRYAGEQRAAIAQAQAAGELPPSARPSDVVMLANAPLSSGDAFSAYSRGPNLRFCVSPSIDRMINP